MSHWQQKEVVKRLAVGLSTSLTQLGLLALKPANVPKIFKGFHLVPSA